MLLSVVFGLLVLGSLCSALPDLDIVILTKLRDLETRLVEQESKIADQAAKLMQQESLLLEYGSKFVEQEQINSQLQHLIDQQQQTINDQHQEILELKSSSKKQDSVVADLEKTVTLQKSNSMSQNFTENQQYTRNVLPSLTARQQPERVAFTAFLDKPLNNLGIEHTVTYNKVLLNEGSAYHPSSGIFTCPLSGLYVFYFSVSTVDVHQSVVKLVVDAVNQVDAISDTFHDNHEAQGSNMAVLSLTQGQQVWVTNYRWPTNQIYDTNSYRFSTFSGFLLY